MGILSTVISVFRVQGGFNIKDLNKKVEQIEMMLPAKCPYSPLSSWPGIRAVSVSLGPVCGS